MPAELFPHQVRLLDTLRHELAAGHKRVVVQAPTGYGKTIVGAVVARGVAAKGNRAVFTVPALSLINQTVEKFRAEGITDIGVIQAKHRLTNPAAAIQVCTAQTLRRREIPPADIVLIDEIHIWHSFYDTWLADPTWANVPFVGLSATPWRKGLGKHFKLLIIGSTSAELIDTGYLSPFRAFAPSSPDLSGVRTVAGDYHEGDLARAVDKPKLVGDVVDTWIARAEGRPTICFAVDCAHARHLQEAFIRSGVPAGYIDANTPVDEREIIAAKFHAGEIKVVCNVGCLTTGIDWDVRCLVLARPTRSRMLFVQMIGRGLRTAAGKADCLILDHSDNHARLGMVTTIGLDAVLDDGTKKHATPVVIGLRKCPECFYLNELAAQVCENCGHELIRQRRPIQIVDGNLVEITAPGIIDTDSPDAPTQFYRELMWIAQERGRHPHWQEARFHDRFGYWQHGLNHYTPLPPSNETLAFVQKCARAYAAAQAAKPEWAR
jgi:superfamily II DNA or RNA helicase